MKKILSALFCLPFVFSSFATANQESLLRGIPTDFARVEKTYQGTNGRTIVFIQSAHVKYEAQKSISEILRALIQRNFLNLILVEGGWGDVRLSFLRSYADQKNRLEVAEHYLKEGKISGDEYLDLVSDLDMMIWGIEDPDAYQKNMEVFLKYYEVQNQLVGEISKFSSFLTSLNDKKFSKELNQLASKRQLFKEDKISLWDYASALLDQSDKSKVHLYPNLQKLVAFSQETSFDSAKLEIQKKELIQILSKKVTKLELERFQLLKDRKHMEGERDHLKLLLSAYQTYQSKLSKIKVDQIEKCLKVLNSVSEGSMDQVFDELDQLEQQIIQTLARTETEQKLIKLQRSVELTERLLKLEIGPKDFERIQSREDFIPVSKWKAIWQSLDEGDLRTVNGTSLRAPEGRSNPGFDFDLIHKWFPQAVSFYESACNREKALIKNAIQKIEETKSQTVAVIAGGFHSETITKEFHKLGFSLIIVSPRFNLSANPEQESGQYFEILKYKWGQRNTLTSNLSLS